MKQGMDGMLNAYEPAACADGFDITMIDASVY
jgi:hypothetical protein